MERAKKISINLAVVRKYCIFDMSLFLLNKDKVYIGGFCNLSGCRVVPILTKC